MFICQIGILSFLLSLIGSNLSPIATLGLVMSAGIVLGSIFFWGGNFTLAFLWSIIYIGGMTIVFVYVVFFSNTSNNSQASVVGVVSILFGGLVKNVILLGGSIHTLLLMGSANLKVLVGEEVSSNFFFLVEFPNFTLLPLVFLAICGILWGILLLFSGVCGVSLLGRFGSWGNH